MSETTTAEHHRREALLDLAEWEPHTPEPDGLEITVTGRAITVHISAGWKLYSFTYEHRPLSGFEARRDFHRLVARFGRMPTTQTARHSMTYRWSR